MNFTIKPVAPTDVAALLELIRELARFEKLEHEVEATEESLWNSFFGPQPTAGALIATNDGVEIGYAIYFFTFSSFVGRAGIWLDDVYVKPEFRRNGLGRRLIEEVARVGVERNCGRYEWSALNWNRNALDFYKKLGAKVMDDWLLLRLDAKGMRRVAGMDPKKLSDETLFELAARGGDVVPVQNCGHDANSPRARRQNIINCVEIDATDGKPGEVCISRSPTNVVQRHGFRAGLGGGFIDGADGDVIRFRGESAGSLFGRMRAEPDPR